MEPASAGTIPMTWRIGDRWSPVTRVVEFIVWRSFRRIPGVRVAIARERDRDADDFQGF